MSLEYLNNAIMFEPEEIYPFIIRSQCFIKLGRTGDALQDADTALEMDRWKYNLQHIETL